MEVFARERRLKDILTEDQLNCIIRQMSKNGSHLIKYELRSATEGMSGFLGDHSKVTLHVREADSLKKLNLFVKTMPRGNAPKYNFINENNFFRREMLTFSVFERISDSEFSGPKPWGVKAFIHSDSTLVLPDLSVEGYKTYPATQYLDLDHVLVAVTSLARFHAAFANLQTQTLNGNHSYNCLSDEYEYFLKDPQFFDCPWLHAGIKSLTNFLKELSTNIQRYPVNLEESIRKWCIEACDSIKEYKETLNVIVHKDLWANNILYKYNGSEPINAILIDFQCARYAPPAYDLIVFLYYTTSRNFRGKHENEVLNHYFSVFTKSVDEPTKRRLEILNYNLETFKVLCEKARLGGMVVPLLIHPFILMSPLAAQKAFDEPGNFQKHYFEDRSGPVLEYARENEGYKARILEISEEFVEKHLNI